MARKKQIGFPVQGRRKQEKYLKSIIARQKFDHTLFIKQIILVKMMQEDIIKNVKTVTVFFWCTSTSKKNLQIKDPEKSYKNFFI